MRGGLECIGRETPGGEIWEILMSIACEDVLVAGKVGGNDVGGSRAHRGRGRSGHRGGRWGRDGTDEHSDRLYVRDYRKGRLTLH